MSLHVHHIVSLTDWYRVTAGAASLCARVGRFLQAQFGEQGRNVAGNPSCANAKWT